MVSGKVLITGVAGLLGSRLAHWIHQHTDYHVVGVDDLSGGFLDIVPESVEFHKFDLVSEFDRLDLLFTYNDFAYVFHMSAYAAEGLSPFIRTFNYNNNLVATSNIVNCCVNHKVTRLVFTSSMAVYGSGTPPFAEDAPYNPIDPYGIAKMACELDIQQAGTQFGLDWCIIRPHNVYGINQNIWDKYRNVLGIWMYQHLNDQPMTIFGDGEQHRAFSYIDDCLRPLWNSATLPAASNEIINLGGTLTYSINQANKTLIDVMGSGSSVHLQKRHEVKYAYTTHQKSIDILHYNDATTLRDGLTSMWEWAKSAPMRDRFVWSSYEIEQGIYDFWK